MKRRLLFQQAQVWGELQWVNEINQNALCNMELTLYQSMMNAFLIIQPMQKLKLKRWPIQTTPLLEEYNMGNRLFQEAREYVDIAKNATGNGQHTAINRAKNALSSAYANSSMAEKEQLQELQKELDQLV
jgi:hypothetical protein